MSNHIIEDLALYALDALPPAEQARVEEHLNTCADCEKELAEYQTAAAALVPDEAPSELTWKRIQARIREEDTTTTAVEQPQAVGAPAWNWRMGIAAAAALVVGVLGAQVFSSSELTGNGIVAAAEQAATQGDAVVTEFVVDSETVAQVILTAEGQGYVIPTNLDPLDSSRTYQLWVLNDQGEAVSGGVLGSEPGPSTFTWTAEITGFALTREVAGGVISSAGDVVAVTTDV